MSNSEQTKQNNKFRTLHKLIILSLLVLVTLPLTTKAVSTTFYPYPNGGSCSSLYSTDLTTDINYEVDSRIQGLNGVSNPSLLNIWNNTTGTAGINTSSWVRRGTSPLDFTGVSPYSDTQGFHSGTLISPRHVVLANHYTVPNGTPLNFYDSSGTKVTRTVVDQMQIDFGEFQDIQVALLDSDVPSSIAYYPIVDVSEFQKHWKSPIDNPIIVLNQQNKALVFDISNIFDRATTTTNVQWVIPVDQVFQSTEVFGGNIAFKSPSNSTRLSFNTSIIPGDSGHPGFIVIGGKLVLSFANHTPTASNFTSIFVPDMNSSMATLDARNGVSSGYQVSTLDLSCFTSQATTTSTFASSTYSFSLPENSASSTVVGNISLTSGLNQYFSVNSKPNFVWSYVTNKIYQAFSTDPVSGNVLVASSTMLNYETTPSFNFNVFSLNKDWFWPNVTATTSVTVNLTNVNEAPYFTQTGFSFTFPEGSLNGQSVGTLTASDVDAGSILTYSIDSGNNGLFAINSSTGAITVANKNLINFDATSSYPLVVRVTDNGSPVLYATTTTIAYVSPTNHPVISLNISATTTADDVGTINVPFTLSYAYGKDINLTFRSVGGTAYDGVDFSLATTTYTIPSGQTTGSIPVNIVYKNLINYSKIFFINIASADKALIGATSSEQVTISNVINNTINEQLATPSISLLTPTPSNTTASISWTSNVTASSTLHYGLSTTYTSTSTDSSTKTHTINLSSLAVCTTYHYQIITTGPAGLIATSSDSAFTTTGCPVVPAVSYSVSSSGGGGGGGGGGSSYVAPANVVTTIPSSTNNASVSTLQPIPASSYKIGDRNKSVTNLQLLLVKAKLMDSSKVTGYFGPITKTALDLYNSKVSKDVSVLNASSSAVSNIVATTSNVINSAVASPSASFEFTKDLSLNMVNEDVRSLQMYLNNNGFPVASSGVGSPGHESNRFGPATKAALIKFQKANKVAGTGLFGPTTRGVVNR